MQRPTKGESLTLFVQLALIIVVAVFVVVVVSGPICFVVVLVVGFVDVLVNVFDVL